MLSPSRINSSGFNKKKKDTAKHKWSNHHHIFFPWILSLKNQWFHKIGPIIVLKEKRLWKLPFQTCVCALSFIFFLFSCPSHQVSGLSFHWFSRSFPTDFLPGLHTFSFSTSYLSSNSSIKSPETLKIMELI